MTHKIEVRMPNNWYFMKKIDGTDLEYGDSNEDYKRAIDVALCIEGCYRLLDKNYKLIVKKV